MKIRVGAACGVGVRGRLLTQSVQAENTTDWVAFKQ